MYDFELVIAVVGIFLMGGLVIYCILSEYLMYRKYCVCAKKGRGDNPKCPSCWQRGINEY